MRIVIDLSVVDYKDIKELEFIPDEINKDVAKAIKNCTVLQAYHGRLIDADAYLEHERPNGIAEDVWKESHIYKSISDAPTVVEASNNNI